jgi:hypothetical protein
LNWNSNLNQINSLKKDETHLFIAGRQLTNSPSAAFGPLVGPASRPRRSHQPRTARGHRQVEPALRHACVMPTSSSSSSRFTPLADGQRPKRGAPAMASPSRRAPRLPAHPGRPRTPTAGAVLAAAHGDEPGSAVNPAATPVTANPYTNRCLPCARAASRTP